MATYRKLRTPDYGHPIIAPTHGDTVAPQNDLAAAAWLPISATATNSSAGFFTYDYQRHVFTDKVVIMPGKLVALTRESLANDNSLVNINQGTVGRLLPAGIRLAWKAAAGSDHILEYTAEDVAERIENLCTGLPVTAADVTAIHASGALGYTKTQVTAALKARGFIRNAETCDAFISRPIGIAANIVYAWAGGDGSQANKLRFMNYRRENKSTFWTGQDHTLRLPVLPKTAATVAVPAFTDLVNSLADFEDSAAATWLQGDGSELSTYLGARYTGLTNTTWVGLALGYRSIEHNLYNPITIKDGSGVDVSALWLKREVSSVQMISKYGDYFVDRDLGILFLYSVDADALPLLSLGGTQMSTAYTILVSYSPVATAVTGSAVASLVKVFAAVTGDVNPGDYLSYDKYSNFVPYVARADEDSWTVDEAGGTTDRTVVKYVSPTLYHRPEDIVGKCYTLDRSPKADLAAVKTFHDYEGVTLADRTPGSATDGNPAEIHQSQGGQFAAIVRVLL